MEINVAKSSGFCFGVKRAIDISRKVAKKNKASFVLGDIVHNSFVVNELEEKGIKKIRRIVPRKDSILIIRAHGAPEKTFGKARDCGYEIVDATCPKVQDIYRIARSLEKKCRIIIIGDSGHDEVKGIAGQLKKRPIIIESPEKVFSAPLAKVKKAAVITQSTQNIENIQAVMDRLEKIIPDVKLYNTTCRITVIKQLEIKSLPVTNDVVLIIGSHKSANTRRLYQISKGINKKTHWIENAEDIKPSWFRAAEKVGIMAGASTPDYVTGAVVKELNRISEKKN